MNKFRLRVVEVGEYGTFLLPLPKETLKILMWDEGDEAKIELVVDRDGKCTHFVVEKVPLG